MKDLIERLEKAHGPDRELDYTIAEWLNPWLVECDYRRLDGDNGWQTETPLVKGANNVAPASAYTASLDAALPDERIVEMVHTIDNTWIAWAHVRKGETVQGRSNANEAIARRIAALKARAASERDMEAGR